MLLIYPPVARSCEPPLGIARLAGLLRARGLPCLALDLCHEGLEYLLSGDIASADTWTRGALRRRGMNMDLLRSPSGYSNRDRYKRAVGDLEKALRASVGGTEGSTVEVGLANYQDSSLSSLMRADLLKSAAEHEKNVFYPFFRARLGEVLSSFETDTVGLSVNFLSQALCAFALAGYLKASFPRLRLVLGGGLVTSWARQGRLPPGETFGGLFDAVLPGRGEDSLPEYLGLPTESGTVDAAGSGAAAPDFDDFAALRHFSPLRVIPYNFTTGCPWKRCTFCPEKAENTRYTGMRPDLAAAEIRDLVRRYNPGLLHFTDNEISPVYLRSLADNPPDAPWYGFARFSRELTDAGFCLRLRESGCAMLQLGLESGDQGVLDALGKGTRIEDIDASLDNLVAAGIGVFLYVLFGTPAENHASALVTRDFVESRADRIDCLNVAIFNLPTASAEAGSLKTTNFYEGDLSLYREFEHPQGWNRDKVRGFLKNEFGNRPGIRAILLRNPPVFTSNHAPFFHLFSPRP